MEHSIPDELSMEALFRYQRKLASSHDLLERLTVLWVAAELGQRLAGCSDHQIGDLLSLVQEGLGLFSPEYGVCEHAKRRLQSQNSWRRK